MGTERELCKLVRFPPQVSVSTFSLQQLNSVAAGIADLAKQPSSGDLNGAQAAFGTLQQLNQSLATASGNSLSSNSQLSTDLTALGSALTLGIYPPLNPLLRRCRAI